jgi:hypothetical protein
MAVARAPAAEREGTELEARLGERECEIVDLLARPWWRRRPRDPELRKVLARLFSNIVEAERLASTANSRLGDSSRARLERIAGHGLEGLTLEAAIEVIDALDQLLIEIGDDTYLMTSLYTEKYRDRRKNDMETPFVTWSDLFGGDGDGERKLATDELRSRLAALRSARSREYRLYRARLEMKARLLLLVAPVLGSLVAGLGVALAVSLDIGAWPTVLAAFAGAIGGTVSGVYKLRDEISRIGDLRALTPALVVQPLLGATAGLLIVLVLVSGLLPPETGGGAVWAKYGVLAFMSGFSEPFFLGVVERVARLAETSGRPPPASNA